MTGAESIEICLKNVAYVPRYTLHEKQFRKIAEHTKAKAAYQIWVGADKCLATQRHEWELHKAKFGRSWTRIPRHQLPNEVAQVLKQQALDGDTKIIEFWKDREKNPNLADIAHKASA